MPGSLAHPDKKGGRQKGPVGRELHRIASLTGPRQQGYRGLRSNVRWPETRPINFTCDAASTGFDPPSFLGDILGYSKWTPLTRPPRGLDKHSRAADPLTNRGNNTNRVPADTPAQNSKRGPADTLGQGSDSAQRPHPPTGPGPSRIRGSSGSVASDTCHTCHHNGSSGVSEEKEVFPNGGALGLSSKGGRQDSNSETLAQDKGRSSEPARKAFSCRSVPCLVPCDTCRLLRIRHKHKRTEGSGAQEGHPPPGARLALWDGQVVIVHGPSIPTSQ